MHSQLIYGHYFSIMSFNSQLANNCKGIVSGHNDTFQLRKSQENLPQNIPKQTYDTQQLRENMQNNRHKNVNTYETLKPASQVIKQTH